jgi:uncharacterized protein YdeI (YjbR/CyaY-like superfamily)
MELELKDGLPIIAFERAEDFAAWIGAHSDAVGMWLKIAKKASGILTVSYAEGVEVALCYGWIDGVKNAYDDKYFIQKFTPRRAKSVWSKINVGKVEALTAAGKMQPAGLAAVEAAKADGRWGAAYDSARTMVVPTDFLAALEANPRAREFFGTLNKTNIYAVCFRIETAKKPETRAARIDKFITMLNEGKAIYS